MTSTNLPLAEDDLRRRIRAALRKNANAWASATMRHDLLMARAVRGMQREAVASWRRQVEPLVLRIVAQELATFDDRGHDARVPQSLLDRIVAELVRGTDDVQRRVQGQLRAVVEAEQEWMQRMTERVLETPAPRPSAPQATATAEQRPFLGRRVDEWFRDYLQGPTGERVKAWVQTGVQRSLTNDEIVRGLRGTKASGYTDGILTGKPRHAVEALVRTAATHAATVTREGMLKQLGVKQVRFLATLDSRTSPQCRALDQQVFPIDEGPRPPLHPNAVLAGSSFIAYGRLEEMVHARYRGQCVHVCAGNYRTTIGPNHPMLTTRGMVPAAQLREGDQLLHDCRGDLSLRTRKPNLEEVHLVEDAFATLVACGADPRVATARHDLHGDRVFCEGEVEVVEHEGHLLGKLDPGGIEQLRELSLVPSDVQARAVSGLGAGDLGGKRVCLPPSGSMGNADAWVLANDWLSWVPVHSVSFGVFVGDAFDATTASSLYCSDGFVVSNCRSTVLPFLGEPTGKRASIDGPVDAQMDYADWLHRQDAATQDDVLGKTKATAWRAGKLTLQQMLGPDLEPLTVAQLRELDRL